eukprot:gene7865-8677_t
MSNSRLSVLSEHEEHLSQLNRWLEDYRRQVEQRDRENFELKLQLAQLFEAVQEKEKIARELESYVVDLEETVQVLGDELDLTRLHLLEKEQEVRSLQTSKGSRSESDSKASCEGGDEWLKEAVALQEENNHLRQRLRIVEDEANDRRSLCLDLKARIAELEGSPSREKEERPQDGLLRRGRASESEEEDELQSPVVRERRRGSAGVAAGPGSSSLLREDWLVRGRSRLLPLRHTSRPRLAQSQSPVSGLGGAQWSPDHSLSQQTQQSVEESRGQFRGDSAGFGRWKGPVNRLDEEGKEGEEEKEEQGRPPPLPFFRLRSLHDLPNRDDLPTPPRITRRLRK